jgi:hypothetical protein
MLGKSGEALVALWTKCTTSNDMSSTCKKIKNVFDFFKTNYSSTCGLGGQPDTPTMLREVYGWAEFPDCPKGIALKNTPGYDTAIAEFCELQYNYLLKPKDPKDIFNPYTRLIHETLKSNAYAFSIDDKAAFKSVPSVPGTSSNELIITIGGPKGLVNTNQTPLPTVETISKFCH